MNEYNISVSNGKEIAEMIGNLDKDIRDSSLKAGARKAAKPVIDEATNIVGRIAKTKEGFSKASYIKRNIKAKVPASRFGLGVNIMVEGNDIPVGNRFWKIYGYAMLLGEGAYKNPDRITRRRGTSRGPFEGFGNFLKKAWNKVSYISEQIYMSEIDTEVQKAFERSNKRLTKKING